MRYELTDYEGDAIKPMLPNQPRDPPPRHSSGAAAIAPLRRLVATLLVPKAILHARHEIHCCKGWQSTDAHSR